MWSAVSMQCVTFRSSACAVWPYVFVQAVQRLNLIITSAGAFQAPRTKQTNQTRNKITTRCAVRKSDHCIVRTVCAHSSNSQWFSRVFAKFRRLSRHTRAAEAPDFGVYGNCETYHVMRVPTMRRALFIIYSEQVWYKFALLFSVCVNDCLYWLHLLLGACLLVIKYKYRNTEIAVFAIATQNIIDKWIFPHQLFIKAPPIHPFQAADQTMLSACHLTFMLFLCWHLVMYWWQPFANGALYLTVLYWAQTEHMTL